MCCEADWKREVVPDHKVSERADWPRQPAAGGTSADVIAARNVMPSGLNLCVDGRLTNV